MKHWTGATPATWLQASIRLSARQSQCTEELWAAHTACMEPLQEEQARLIRAMGVTRGAQASAGHGTALMETYKEETGSLIGMLALQRECTIHMLRRFQFEVLTPFEVIRDHTSYSLQRSIFTWTVPVVRIRNNACQISNFYWLKHTSLQKPSLSYPLCACRMQGSLGQWRNEE